MLARPFSCPLRLLSPVDEACTSSSYDRYEYWFPLIKLYVIFPVPYRYCLCILSPVAVSRVLAAQWPSAIMCFLGWGDRVMMLDRGTVSVLRASCDSTEGWEKYKGGVR